ncbi:MAG: hypothetical protein AMXMBFR83_03510 [Phycisphaerae bacterium]|jgi:hypothetical protein
MKSKAESLSPGARASLVGLLTWLLPGAGHLFLGERIRGVILLATITVTFWTGVAVGGVKNTVNPERWGWFMGQICAGGHTLATLAWSRQIADPPQGEEAALKAFGREEEVSVVYTGICGMLNILILFDALVRSERLGLVPVQPAGPRPGRGSGP